MAAEYRLYTTATAPVAIVLNLVATVLHAEPVEIGFARDGITVEAWPLHPDDDNLAGSYGQHNARLEILYRHRPHHTNADQETADIINSVVTLLRTHPGDATLIHHEQIVLRQRDGLTTINTDWPGWHETPTLRWYRQAIPSRSMPTSHTFRGETLNREQIIDLLNRRRTNPVSVRLGEHYLVGVVNVDYDPRHHEIVLDLDPIALSDILTTLATDNAHPPLPRTTST
ncbi:SitI3 family protein [Solwaraspora sp. WMMD791]|uniref:SitI3 family protein n=1 Tax=Solwaraspora sp. WMMD791 TaxID=3016086 RepID=UPI00249C02F9|nr:SitI3 family protein [Solwaraspora sp. WMMD791]WFE27671.1 SitI3 family protein [Solwaraspora sp. WMMD791]